MDSKGAHKQELKKDEDMIKIQTRLRELEKTLQVLRTEVEQSASHNEKLKIEKE